MAMTQQYNPQTGAWEWSGQEDPGINFGSGSWSATTPNPFSGGLSGSQLNGGSPSPSLAPPATPPPANQNNGPNPMSFFRTDYAPTYNPFQYGNNQAQQSVGNVLGPSAQFGMTATGFGVPSQSVVNYGGENHNTGLVQNLINQYGAEQAKKMLDTEAAYAKANGGGNWTLNNDASLTGYEGYRGAAAFAPTSPSSYSVFNTPNNFNSNNYTSQAANQQAQQAANNNAQLQLQNTQGGLANPNGLAGLSGLLNQQNAGTDFNGLLTVLMLLGMLQGGGQQRSATLPQVTPNLTTNRNPSLYSLFY